MPVSLISASHAQVPLQIQHPERGLVSSPGTSIDTMPAPFG
jgi:hypothetical protein